MIKKILLSALILSAAQIVSAANVSHEEDKLDRLYQAFENRTSDLEDVENELFGYDYKLDRARQDLKTAEAELAIAEQEHAKAKAAVASEDSEEKQRALKMAEHTLNMSERGVRTRSKRLERVESSLAELQSAKTRLDAQIVAAQKRVQEQEGILAVAKNAQVTKAREEAQSLQAEKSQPNAPAVVAEKAPRSAPAIPTSIPEQVVATRAGATTKSTVAAATTAEAAPQGASAADTAERSELDQEAQEHARNEVAKLQELLNSSDAGRPTFKNLLLTGNKMDPELFEFLGQDQYRVDAVVSNGRQIFEIGRHKFRRTIPTSDNGQTYVFIYDAKRLSRPRLVMFKKSLVENF